MGIVVLDTAVSWHIEHRNFERLLAFLEDQLELLRVGETPSYALMCDVTDYICHFAARYHHAREDIAFGYILQSNPSMSDTISRLVREHAEITVKANELVALLDRAYLGNTVASASIKDVLTAFLTIYRNHLLTEEQHILPYAADNLSTIEWESVSAAAGPGTEPLRQHGASLQSSTFGSEVEGRYRALCARIPAGHSMRNWVHSVRTVENHRDDGATASKEVSGSVAVSPASETIPVPRVAVASRLLVRQTVILLALVLTYLQYYYIDVQMQILNLPSVFPGLPN